MLPQRPTPNNAQKLHVDHSVFPCCLQPRGRCTLVKSQWKLHAYPGHFRVQINSQGAVFTEEVRCGNRRAVGCHQINVRRIRFGVSCPKSKVQRHPPCRRRTGSPARREPRRTRQADREPTRSAADARQAPEASARAAFGRVDSRRRLRQQHRNAARNRKTEGGADQGKSSHPATFRSRKPPEAASCPARSWGHRGKMADDLQPLTYRLPKVDISPRQTTACSLHHSCSSTHQGNRPRLPTPAATRWARPRMFCRG